MKAYTAQLRKLPHFSKGLGRQLLRRRIQTARVLQGAAEAALSAALSRSREPMWHAGSSPLAPFRASGRNGSARPALECSLRAGWCEWNVGLAPFYLVLFPSSGSSTEMSASKYKFGEPEIVSELRDRAGWSSTRSISFLSFLTNMVRRPEAPSRTPGFLTGKHTTSSTAEMQLPGEVEIQCLIKIIFLNFTLNGHCAVS